MLEFELDDFEKNKTKPILCTNICIIAKAVDITVA